MIPLETERLIIRNFRPDDWPALQALAVAYRASESAKYEDPWPTSDEEVQGMASWFATGDGYLAACLKPAGTLIGLVAIEQRDSEPGQVHNLGYVFHPGYHGHGYATEACRAAMAYLFDRLGADRILTGTHPDNAASVRLLARLGFQALGNGAYVLDRAAWGALQNGQRRT